MIKRKLSLLACSVILASGANAAIVAGNAGTVDSSLVLGLIDSDATAGNVATYWVELPGTVDDILGGNGFSVSLSAAASSFLGGFADSWVLFGNKENAAPFTSDSSNSIYGNFGDNVGTVYANTAPEGGKAVASEVQADMGVLRTILASISGSSEVGALQGTAGDFDAFGFGAFSGIKNALGDTAGLFYSQINPTARALTPVENGIAITGPGGSVEGAYLDGNTFNITTEAVAAVPVPAAAWLFGSALLGLGVVRRK